MPCPPGEQPKCHSGKNETRSIRLSSSQHISWLRGTAAFFFWSLRRCGIQNKDLSSQDEMEIEASECRMHPHSKLCSHFWPILCPNSWSSDENSSGSDLPPSQCKGSSKCREMDTQPSIDSCLTSLHKTLSLSAASTDKQKNPSVGHEEHSCEYGSLSYLLLCSLGGLLSCGVTHTAVVPLDVVKCRMQVEPKRYRGLVQGLTLTVQEEGTRGLVKGWAPTAIGYSMQGLGKFGLYEFFKIHYSDLLGPEQAYLWRTSIYLAASASAEFFADIALAPMEAVKVRIQTQEGYANTLREAAPKMYIEEGLWAFYKGVAPLWMRQIPYTMMKFSCFERTVEALYKYVVPKPRDKCSKMEQLGVTFVGGYIAGIFCAVVSHPADSVVSVLNKEKGSTAIDVLRRLGIYGIWKGLFTRILMIGTLTALQWFIYDSVKVYLKLPRPPPPEMPASLKKKL
ncbi:Phosphate carrier protein, mitochondrial [Varanus komodoensis]|uniref:phosphate carrier protein, mitochondrial-like n=1 Tax=Varanus komodoensis TaxID=61221 RepID=UPI001CF7762B|nr:phosphate carrier protein, mitochondrial-like [Varanus komodoensis]KAF7244289.1 Phosphate carrier protein, mitochondrial [Varanus komodoensis]